jgi:hypothetical protein
MNLDLSNTEQRQVHQAMTDIEQGLDGLLESIDAVINLVSASQFDELRAYRGTIRDAHYRLTELFYNAKDREPDAPIGRPIDRAIALIAEAADSQASVDSHPAGFEPYDGKHPCRFDGCTHTVLFDDEPYCFTHSPDEGSSVRGYSDREAVRFVAERESIATANRLWGAK